MRKPPEGLTGFGEALLGLATARGGAGWWCSLGCGMQAALWLGCVCNWVRENAQSAARPMARSAGPIVQRRGELAVARRRWVAGVRCAAS